MTVLPPLLRMMMSWFYVFIFYFFSLNLFLNANCPILFWVMMEINLISFCLIMLMEKSMYVKMDSTNYIIYYFIVQSSASMLFLSNYSFLDWGSIFNSEHMFLVSMILKIGLFPLFFWIFTLSSSLSFISLLILLTFQKIPLFSIMYNLNSHSLELILFFSFISGSLMLLYSNNFLFMCISSSISYSFILYFFFSFSFKFFLGFFLLYSLFLGSMLMLLSLDCPLNRQLLFWCFCFFLGLPPMGLFFFKLLFAQEIYFLFGSLEVLSFWAFTFLGLMGYLKFFYYSFYSLEVLHYKNTHPLKSTLFLLFSFFSCIVFLSGL